MSGQSFLVQAFVYLAAAVIAVPLAKRFGLGSVLGYLLAGIAIGPHVLGLLGTDGQDVMHFAEFGVVMMLFVVGLELEPSLLWRLRSPILGMGGLQVAVTALVVAVIAALLGLPWPAALAIGMILAMSSTAIVLQSLNEKGLMKTAGGQSSFAILLFQDIAVIPMLAVFPLLAASPAGGAADGTHGQTLFHGLPGWAQTIAVLGAIGFVLLAGRYMIRPVFRIIAQARSREVFTAAALLLVIGVALVMTEVGLSPALGAFLAGVMLANSEYRHELESDIDPFKGLLLGLFFIAVGASIDFRLIADEPLLIIGLVVAVLFVKSLVLYALGWGFRLGVDQRLLICLALPQVGEFAFVLLSFANQEGVLTPEVASPLVAVVALSMAVTPVLFMVNDKFIQPRVGTRRSEQRESDLVDERQPVIIAGFGSFGSTVGRLLRANRIATTVLDIDSDRVDLLRAMGLNVYYGDATRLDLLHTAGAATASLMVVALDTPEKTIELVHVVKHAFPKLQILARAFDAQDAHELYAAGVDRVYRTSFDASLRMGSEALNLLGFRAYQAHRAAQKFMRHDELAVRELTASRGDRAGYISATRRHIEDLESMLALDLKDPDLDRDAGWDAESLRQEFSSRPPADSSSVGSTVV